MARNHARMLVSLLLIIISRLIACLRIKVVLLNLQMNDFRISRLNTTRFTGVKLNSRVFENYKHGQ